MGQDAAPLCLSLALVSVTGSVADAAFEISISSTEGISPHWRNESLSGISIIGMPALNIRLGDGIMSEIAAASSVAQ